MTDRFNMLFVVLAGDIREDDAEVIINAIRMVKGVLSVEPNVVDHTDHIARERIKQEFGEKIWNILHPKS